MANLTGKKELLLDALRRTPSVQGGFIASLSTEALNRTGTLEHWSIKDTINHLTFWQEMQCDRIERLLRGLPKRDTSDIDTLNRENYVARRDISWEAARQQSEAALGDLLRLTGSLTEEQCVSNLLWMSIQENGFMHPILHIAEHYVAQGDPARGLAFYEAQIKAVDVSADRDKQWHSVCVYNLATFCVRRGMIDRALGMYPEPFSLVPELRGWAKDDPDLATLRQDPRFQALLNG